MILALANCKLLVYLGWFSAKQCHGFQRLRKTRDTTPPLLLVKSTDYSKSVVGLNVVGLKSLSYRSELRCHLIIKLHSRCVSNVSILIVFEV